MWRSFCFAAALIKQQLHARTVRMYRSSETVQKNADSCQGCIRQPEAGPHAGLSEL